MIEADSVLYKVLLDLYYQLHLVRRNYKIILTLIIPAMIKSYQMISKTAFSGVLKCLNTVLQDRLQRLSTMQIDGQTTAERAKITSQKDQLQTSFHSTFFDIKMKHDLKQHSPTTACSTGMKKTNSLTMLRRCDFLKDLYLKRLRIRSISPYHHSGVKK